MVDVYDGSVMVDTTGALEVEDVRLGTNRYSNTLALSGAVSTAIGDVELGTLVQVELPTDGSLVVAKDNTVDFDTRVTTQPVYGGSPAELDIRVLGDLSKLYGDDEGIRVRVDWGDGSDIDTLTVPITADPIQAGSVLDVIASRPTEGPGRAVTSIGDVNGDKIPDLVVSEPFFFDDGGVHGRVTLWVSSEGDKYVETVSDIRGGDIAYGELLAPVGDVDGDGRGDFLVSAPKLQREVVVSADEDEGPQGDLPESRVTYEGEVYLYSGFEDAGGLEPIAKLSGGTLGEGFGTSLTGGVDVNRDDFDDFFIGSPNADGLRIESDRNVTPLEKAGEVRGYFGHDDGFSDVPTWLGSGQREGERFGASLAAGDVNGDGFGDLVVGAPGDGGDVTGRLYVFLGSGRGFSLTADQVIEAPENVDLFAETIAPAGDVNQDGLADILVVAGAGGENGVLLFRGSNRGSNRGIEEQPSIIIEGQGVILGFAQSTGAAGDVNGDGIPDVFVTAAEESSREGFFDVRTFVFFGENGALSTLPIQFGPTQTISATAVGTATLSNGPLVSSLADLNGDGLAEIVVAGDQHVQIIKSTKVEFGQTLVAQTTVEHTFDLDGEYQIQTVALGPNDSGAVDTIEQTVLFDIPEVARFVPTESGFQVLFTRPIDPSELNLYGDEVGGWPQADVSLLHHESGELIQGSMILSEDGLVLEFVQTGGRLAGGAYTATVRSAEDAFRGLNGRLLDVEGDQVGGVDFVESFEITGGGRTPILLSIDDMVRGPGQRFSSDRDDPGLVISLNQANGIYDATFVLGYDPRVFEITDVTLGPAVDPDARVVFSDRGGQLIIRVSATDGDEIGRRSLDLVYIDAVVSEDAAIGTAQVLELTNVVYNRRIAGGGDRGVHVVAFPGEATGDGRYGASDAEKILRTSIGLDEGFAAYPSLDPILVADINANGLLGTEDARAVLRESIGLDSGIPGGGAGAGALLGEGGGAGSFGESSPRIRVVAPSSVETGTRFAGSLEGEDAAAINSLELTMDFDSEVFTAESTTLASGELLDGALFESYVDATTGEVRLAAVSLGGITGSGTIAELDLAVRYTATEGPTVIDLTSALLDDGASTPLPTPTSGLDTSDMIIDVVVANRPPIVEEIGTITARVGERFDLQIVAEDPDGDDDQLYYYFEGGFLGTWFGATIEPTTGFISWTPSYLHDGLSETVNIVVEDAGSPTAVTTISVDFEVESDAYGSWSYYSTYETSTFDPVYSGSYSYPSYYYPTYYDPYESSSSSSWLYSSTDDLYYETY